jgi:hypothetical protein
MIHNVPYVTLALTLEHQYRLGILLFHPTFACFFFLQFLILNHTVRNKSVNCSVKMTELGANELSHDERGMYEQHK